jgi:drug/metabolite transporter (DMT)-like permease
MRSWLVVGALGVLGSGIAYVLFFRLIQRIGMARAVNVTYLVPLFGGPGPGCSRASR